MSLLAELTSDTVEFGNVVVLPLVMLVDDDADTVDLYSQFLAFHGYRVLGACNGSQAVGLARAERPRLILMDIEMPVMSGVDAVRVLRADPAFNQTVIVALTAHARESDRMAAMHAGFDAFIAKPCLPDALVAAVERLLTTARQG